MLIKIAEWSIQTGADFGNIVVEVVEGPISIQTNLLVEKGDLECLLRSIDVAKEAYRDLAKPRDDCADCMSVVA